MRLFTFQRAAGVDDAVQAGAQPEAAFLAGGTSLVDLMKLEVLNPGHVIDITRIELSRIESSPDGLRLGALVTNTDLAEHAEVKRRLPAVSEALLAGASPQLRNVATVGGNLLQRTRCAYLPGPRDALQQAAARRRLLGDGRMDAHARHPRDQRTVHRSASLGPVRRARRAGRDRARAERAR